MWNYKGFEIAISGEKFRTEINGKAVLGASLAAVKKHIDKHLDAQAENEAINIPVLRYEHYGDAITVVDDAITGIDINDLRLLYAKGQRQYGRLLPVTDENRALLMQLQEADRVADALRRKVEARDIHTFLGRHSRTKVTLADAKARLLANYEAAVKASQEG